MNRIVVAQKLVKLARTLLAEQWMQVPAELVEHSDLSGAKIKVTSRGVQVVTEKGGQPQVGRSFSLEQDADWVKSVARILGLSAGKTDELGQWLEKTFPRVRLAQNRAGKAVEYTLSSSDRRATGGVFITSVDTIGFDGRTWYWISPEGLKSAYSDENKFQYSLSQELRSSGKARNIIEQLKDEFRGGRAKEGMNRLAVASKIIRATKLLMSVPAGKEVVVAVRPGGYQLVKTADGYELRHKGQSKRVNPASILARGYWTPPYKSKQAASGKWEAPTSKHRLWRRLRKDGTYEYRDAPPSKSKVAPKSDNPFRLAKGQVLDGQTAERHFQMMQKIARSKADVQKSVLHKLSLEYNKPEEEIKEAANSKIRIALDNAKVAVRVPDAVLTLILVDGRVKNQSETLTPSVWKSAVEKRMVAEASLFSVSTDRDPKSRPIYGYMTDEESTTKENDWGSGGHSLWNYGDVRITLKPEAKSRTTVCAGDSLQIYEMDSFYAERGEDVYHQQPMKLNNADFRAFPSMVGGFNPFRDQPNIASLIQSSSDGRYVEAQIHGGITTDDIELITFLEKPDDDVMRLLQQRGVKWKVEEKKAEL